ncbi:hypothetical protein Tsubulata_006921, partial [Turnera subulata]
MLLVNVSFGIVNVLSKEMVDRGMNHMAIAAYRQSLAFSLLAPFAYYWERKIRPKLTAPVVCYLFFGALIGSTLQQYFYLLGLKQTSPTFASAFLNTVPVNTFVIAIILREEKVKLKSKAGKAKVLGALICMAGTMVLILYKGIPLTRTHPLATETNIKAGKGKESWVLGSIFVVAASLTWSTWFIIQGKISKRYPCQFSSTAILAFFAAIQSAVLGLIIQRDASVWMLKGEVEFIGIPFAGMVGSGLCYVGMSWCVKQRGPVFTAAFTPLNQIFSAIFDLAFLHQQIYLGRQEQLPALSLIIMSCCGRQCKPVVAMVVINLAFGIVNVVLKKIIDGEVNSMAIVAYRQAIGFGLLAPFAYYWERKSRPRLTAPILCYLFLGALLGLTFSQYLFLMGLKYTSATLSCAFLNTVPVNTFIIALTLGLEKVHPKTKAGSAKVLGALICVAGIILLVLYKGIPLSGTHSTATETGITGGNKPEKWAFGTILLMAGALMWSSWFIIQAKVGSRYPCQYSSTAIVSFFAAIQSAVLGFIIQRDASRWILKGELDIIGVLYTESAVKQPQPTTKGDDNYDTESQGSVVISTSSA